MRISKLLLLLTILSCTSLAFADEVPVVDGYSDSPSTATTSSSSPSSNDNSNAAYSNSSGPAVATPVSSASAANAAAPAVSSLPLDQRVAVLERQVNSMTQMLQQMNALQQQVQTLSGQLDVEKHNLKTLQDQMRSQYADLDQRLSSSSAKPAVKTAVKNNATSATTDDSADQSTAAAATDAAANNAAQTTDASADQTAYQAAFDLLKNKQYPQATTAFRKFIKQYPASSNLVNAYYWLGQLYLLQGQPDKAIAQFQYILKKRSDDPKAPDTMVQLGLAYYAKGNTKQAVDTLNKVQQQYPNTAAAKLAKSRLQKIQPTNQTAAASSASANANSDSSGDDSSDS